VPKDRDSYSNKLRSLARIKKPELVYRLEKEDNLGSFSGTGVSSIVRYPDANRSYFGLGLSLVLNKSLSNKERIASNSVDYRRDP